MRQITENAVQAFQTGTNFKNSNTEVIAEGNSTKMLLFGNEIAEYVEGEGLYVSNGGYRMTATTKERLNGLPIVQVNTRKGTTYLNGAEWNGKKTKVQFNG